MKDPVLNISLYKESNVQMKASLCVRLLRYLSKKVGRAITYLARFLIKVINSFFCMLLIF